MSENSAVELIGEWQTGALYVFGSLFSGLVVGALLGRSVSGVAGVVGFVLGAVGAFLLISYVRYGR
ncbi:hypothetical protein JCM30237_15620 [Halolamina litorea]|uniref:DUF8144 domain-containing protein n=1 Tax=Halolamina litorea TaxID=1515593 RepID=A0ABD6BP08_9EURY|nr:hypothetical protein [Halolamina litorea]